MDILTTAIVARAPEEVMTIAMTNAAWRAGSVFICMQVSCPNVAAKGEVVSKIAKSVL
jgi:hypothetical protein